MQRDTRLWDYFGKMLAWIMMLVLSISITLAIPADIGLIWGITIFIIGLFVYFFVFREIVRNLVGCVRGLKVGFWVVKQE